MEAANENALQARTRTVSSFLPGTAADSADSGAEGDWPNQSSDYYLVPWWILKGPKERRPF